MNKLHLCQYSGDYTGVPMMKYSFNSIRVSPNNRKEFRGKKASLVFIRNTKYTYRELLNGSFGRMPLVHSYSNKPNKYKGQLPAWEYYLKSEVLGSVNGIYINSTHSPKVVLRKIRRLTRNYKLQIKWADPQVDLKYHEISYKRK